MRRTRRSRSREPGPPPEPPATPPADHGLGAPGEDALDRGAWEDYVEWSGLDADRLPGRS